MNDGDNPVLISLRQADGEHYTLFHRHDADTVNLSLVTASEGQAEADIQFFHHPSSGSGPRQLGVLRFPDLPLESSEAELHLDAVVGPTGLLTVTVRHRESGRVERLEMELPEEPASPAISAGRGRWRSPPARWILGIAFILLSLALVFGLTWLVTDWGREPVVEPPLSLVQPDSVIQRTRT